VDEPLGDFVDGAIAAGGYDQPGAALDVVARDGRGRARARSGRQLEIVPRAP
jgi:hypothetical protein